MTKVCSCCKRELPLEAFGKLARSKDGLKSACKECRNAKTRVYHSEHREHERAYKKMYVERNYEKVQASRKRYKIEHKEEIKIKGKIYYEIHKERIKVYLEINKDRISESKRTYYRETYSRFCIKGEEEKVMHYAEAKADNFKKWVRHHRLETHTSDGFLRPVQLTKAELIALDMYYNRPAEELIWLNSGVHRTVHGKEKRK